MLRLLIVDDERIVLDSMRFIIERYVSHAVIVGTARTGREAIEKGLELRPDVIFMDIRMPGIQGIEAIRELKRMDGRTAFVIVSAYEYFDYAKEAIQLGVFDYLLKPIKKEQVIDLLGRLDAHLQAQNEEIKKQMALREQVNKMIPHLKEQFIYTLLLMGRSLQDLSFYEEIFQMKLGRGYVLIAGFTDMEKNTNEVRMKQSVARRHFYIAFAEALQREVPSLVGPQTLDRIIAYIPAAEDFDAYSLRNRSIELAKRLLHEAGKAEIGGIRVGIGGVYPIAEITTSYEEANIAASIRQEEPVLHYQDLPTASQKGGIGRHLILQRFIAAILSNDEKGAEEALHDWFNWLMNHDAEDPDQVRSHFIEIYMHLIRLSSDGEKGRLFFQQPEIMRLMKMRSSGDMKVMLMEDLKHFFVRQRRREDMMVSGIVSEAVQYIKAHFTDEELTLDAVAKEVNVSYHHFSKIFKSAMGKTFIDYLTELRVGKAKELLQSSDHSIKEICYLAGYGDPNYFSKSFKKATGFTPSEYKEHLKKEGILR